MGIEKLTTHIEVTPGVLGGKPRISGRRISVYQIVVLHDRVGLSADEIAQQYDLSLADVYAGLAYYFDHRDEIEAREAKDEAYVSKMQGDIDSKLPKRA